eukprot:7320669-Pyramimonas_sp.AAC.1
MPAPLGAFPVTRFSCASWMNATALTQPMGHVRNRGRTQAEPGSPRTSPGTASSMTKAPLQARGTL